MDTHNKCSSVWRIRHSRRFNGRLYFYNTLTNESVWDLSRLGIERPLNLIYEPTEVPTTSYEVPSTSHEVLRIPHEKARTTHEVPSTTYNVLNTSHEVPRIPHEVHNTSHLCCPKSPYYPYPTQPVIDRAPQNITAVAPEPIKSPNPLPPMDLEEPEQSHTNGTTLYDDINSIIKACDVMLRNRFGKFKRRLCGQNVVYTAGEDNVMEDGDMESDEEDLRARLLAKRRKSVDIGTIERMSAATKKMKTSSDEPPRPTVVKRVTFNIPDDSVVSTDNINSNKNPERITYVVADIETLLDELQTIEDYVQSDPKRRLVISADMKSSLQDASRSTEHDRRRVISARRICRKIVEPPNYYVMLQKHAYDQNSPMIEKCILDCLDLMIKNDVVLITNNLQLYERAIRLKISCHKAFEISIPFQNGQYFEQENVEKTTPKKLETCTVKNKDQNVYKKSIFDDDYDDSRNNMEATTSQTNVDKILNSAANYNESKAMKNIGEKNNESVNRFDSDSANGIDNESIEQRNYNKVLDVIANDYYIEEDVKENIKLKIDEWCCIFAQIMENLFADIIFQECSMLVVLFSDPWFLYEYTEKILDLYDSHKVQGIGEILKDLLAKECDKEGKFIMPIEPKAFVKLLRCGIFLVESLKEILPNNEEIPQSEVLLKELLENLKNLNIEEPPLLSPPVPSRDCEDTRPKRNFVKDRSEIIRYLKAHYPAWKNAELYEETEMQAKQQKPNIVRTIGRNLSLLKINNSKIITVNKPPETTHGNTVSGNNEIIQKDNLPPSTDNYENLPKTTTNHFVHGNTGMAPLVVTKNIESRSKVVTRSNSTKNMVTSTDIDGLNEPKHGNTFNQESAGPTVIRQIPKSFPNVNKNTLSDTVMPKKYNLRKYGLNNHDITAGPVVTANKQKDSNDVNTHNTMRESMDLDALNFEETQDTEKVSEESDTVSFVYKINYTKPKTANENQINDKNNTHKIQKNENSAPNNDIALNNDMPRNNYRGFNSASKNYNASNNDIAPNNYKGLNSASKNYTASNNDIALQNDKPTALFNDSSSAFNNDNTINSDVSNCVPNQNDNDMIIIDDDENDSDLIIISDSSNDSGICNNDSIQAYYIAKQLFCEVTDAYKLTYDFNKKILQELQKKNGKLNKSRKKGLRIQTMELQLHILEILTSLQEILKRESDESTFQKLIKNAGPEITSDIRMTQYRDTVMRLHKQGMVLIKSLRYILGVFDNDPTTVNTAIVTSGPTNINNSSRSPIFE